MCTDDEQYIACDHCTIKETPGCDKKCNEPDKIKFKPTAVNIL